MTGMLADLVNSVADEFRTALGSSEPANDEGEQLFDRLRAAGLLDIPDLVALLLRHAEEEHISAGIRAARGGAKLRFLQSLVSDQDLEVSAAAMALILAIGRRRDRFGGPRVAFDDISAEAASALVNAIAAGLRDGLLKRLSSAEAASQLGMKPYPAQKLFAQVRNYSTAELDAALIRLARLDHALKGGSRLANELELERALVEITQPQAA